MSGYAMYWAAEQGWDKELESSTRLVLVMLGYYANKDSGLSNPSAARLGMLTGLSDRAIRKAMGRIREARITPFSYTPGQPIAWTFPCPPKRKPPAPGADLPGTTYRPTPAPTAAHSAKTPAPGADKPGFNQVNQITARAPMQNGGPREGHAVGSDGIAYAPGSGRLPNWSKGER